MTSETSSPQPEKPSTKCFREKVNMTKVNKIFVKRWIIDQLQKHVPDDDIAVEFIYELLVGAEHNSPDISVIRSYTVEILGKAESTQFCVALWRLLLEAQKSKNGIPKNLLEERMKVLSQGEKSSSRESNESKNSNAGISIPKIEDGVDKRALQEANHIIESLRPRAGNSSYSRGSKSTKNHNNRVEKPGRKTNYNRA